MAQVHRPHARRDLGKIHFWLLFIGFHTTFFLQHWLGVEGMPDVRGLPAERGFTILNQISSAGAFLLGASSLPFLYNVWKSRHNPKVNTDDPWGGVARWSGLPPVRRRDTISPRFLVFGPSRLPSIYTIRRSRCRSTTTTRRMEEEEEEFFEETAVDAGQDTGRKGELKARVRGTTSDLAAQYEAGHHFRSPEPEEDQR